MKSKVFKKVFSFSLGVFFIGLQFIFGVRANAANTSKKAAQNIIHIAMASDNNYAYPMIVAMTSILENKNKNTKIDFHLMLSGDFSKASKEKIYKLKKSYDGCEIHLINMKNKMKELYTCGHVTTATYYRLLLPDLLSKFDRVLYLDCDILVNKALDDLYKLDLKGNYFAGVTSAATNDETYMTYGKRLINAKGNKYIDAYGWKNYAKKYINAGIILFDLKKMRNDKLVPKLISCASSYKWGLCDQDVLNWVCYDRILQVSNLYNKKSRLCDGKNQPIIHFISRGKPWNKTNMRNADLWWQYAYKSPYFKEIATKYLFNSREKIKHLPKDLQEVIKTYNWPSEKTASPKKEIKKRSTENNKSKPRAKRSKNSKKR